MCVNIVVNYRQYAASGRPPCQLGPNMSCKILHGWLGKALTLLFYRICHTSSLICYNMSDAHLQSAHVYK
jgi:hypothetical protein